MRERECYDCFNVFIGEAGDVWCPECTAERNRWVDEQEARYLERLEFERNARICRSCGERFDQRRHEHINVLLLSMGERPLEADVCPVCGSDNTVSFEGSVADTT